MYLIISFVNITCKIAITADIYSLSFLKIKLTDQVSSPRLITRPFFNNFSNVSQSFVFPFHVGFNTKAKLLHR